MSIAKAYDQNYIMPALKLVGRKAQRIVGDIIKPIRSVKMGDLISSGGLSAPTGMICSVEFIDNTKREVVVPIDVPKVLWDETYFIMPDRSGTAPKDIKKDPKTLVWQNLIKKLKEMQGKAPTKDSNTPQL